MKGKFNKRKKNTKIPFYFHLIPSYNLKKVDKLAYAFKCNYMINNGSNEQNDNISQNEHI